MILLSYMDPGASVLLCFLKILSGHFNVLPELRITALSFCKRGKLQHLASGKQIHFSSLALWPQTQSQISSQEGCWDFILQVVNSQSVACPEPIQHSPIAATMLVPPVDTDGKGPNRRDPGIVQGMRGYKTVCKKGRGIEGEVRETNFESAKVLTGICLPHTRPLPSVLEKCKCARVPRWLASG